MTDPTPATPDEAARCQFPNVLPFYDHDGVCGKGEAHRWHGQHDEGYCDGAHESHVLCHPYQPLVPLGDPS